MQPDADRSRDDDGHERSEGSTDAAVPAEGSAVQDADGAVADDRVVEAPMSQEEVDAFLVRAKEALIAEGFAETPFQYRKKGQVFGVVKDHGHDLQLHVRAFDTGVIESEVELSNRYIEHLVSPRRSAHAEIKAVFEKHGLETETINEEFQTRTGSIRERIPRTRTKTSDLVKAGLGMAGAIGAIAVARFVQRSGSRRRTRRGRR